MDSKEQLNNEFLAYVGEKLEKGLDVKIIGKCCTDDELYAVDVIYINSDGCEIKRKKKATGIIIAHVLMKLKEFKGEPTINPFQSFDEIEKDIRSRYNFK